MATAGSKHAAAADQEFDPRYEWQENATSFILRIHLSGFRKQDFRVQVDGAGRLTVRGQRSDAAANPRHSRFSKVFQLPSTSNLDDIAGRFEAGVLTLTVPKRLPASQQQQVQDLAAAKQQAKAPPAGDAKLTPTQDQRKGKEDEDAKKPKDDAIPKPKAKDEDATTKKPAAEQQVVDAKSGKPEPEQQHKAAAPPPPAVRKEEGKPKPGAAAAAPAPAAATDTASTRPPPLIPTAKGQLRSFATADSTRQDSQTAQIKQKVDRMA
ncbi:inactive protein RESTRICTED TEV MOVEMENT 2-like [Miscanthus floridulus]|uniref:inactive protein RESTRICTED TEV MOVEMENT 2-like n=1 Tax=Miscanthus floridulus TaxID=154761 RepID=UPI003458700A